MSTGADGMKLIISGGTVYPALANPGGLRRERLKN